MIVSQLRQQLDTSKIARHVPMGFNCLIGQNSRSPTFADVAKDQVITHDKLWDLFESFIRPRDIVMGETGTAGYGVREMQMPANVRVFAPVTWLSIGYMLPAAQGAALAQRELHSPANGTENDSSIASGRTILFIGDGSLQMTVQEISTMIRHNLNIIIVVINNDGYTIERAIHGLKEKYNDVARWRYLGAPSFFGAEENSYTASARTWGELEAILADERLSDGQGLRMVELILDREDVTRGPLAALMRIEKERNSS